MCIALRLEPRHDVKTSARKVMLINFKGKPLVLPGVSDLRYKDIDERYWDSTRGQRKALQEFAKSEIEWAGILMKWYGRKKAEMPDDEYRACAFFANREFARKLGSLTLCLRTRERCDRDFPRFEKEFAFDFLRYRFKAYAQALKAGARWVRTSGTRAYTSG